LNTVSNKILNFRKPKILVPLLVKSVEGNWLMVKKLDLGKTAKIMGLCKKPLFLQQLEAEAPIVQKTGKQFSY